MAGRATSDARRRKLEQWRKRRQRNKLQQQKRHTWRAATRLPKRGGDASDTIYRCHFRLRERVDVFGRGAVPAADLWPGDCCRVFANAWSRFIYGQADPRSADHRFGYFDDQAFTSTPLPLPSRATQLLPSSQQDLVFRTPQLADDVIIESPPGALVDVYGLGPRPLEDVLPGHFCRASDGPWAELLGGYFAQRGGEKICVVHTRRETLTDEQGSGYLLQGTRVK